MILPVLLLPALVASAGDIYKWKDAEGRTHLSDQPPAAGEAERLQIRTFSGPAETSAIAATPGSQSEVVMLSASWCGVCKRARAWLIEHGVPFTEHDVEHSDTGKSEYRRLNGRGVPIILVGRQRMDGFSAAQLEAMLHSAD